MPLKASRPVRAKKSASAGVKVRNKTVNKRKRTKYRHEGGKRLSEAAGNAVGKRHKGGKAVSVVEKEEKKPRRFVYDEPTGMARMPLKDADGTVVRSIMPASDHEESSDESTETPVRPTASLPQRTDDETRNRIGEIADAILQAPQDAIRLIEEVFDVYRKGSDELRRFATASATELLLDVIPGYRIRPPSVAESSQSVSKDVRKLWDYEACLLAKYRTHVSFLEKQVSQLQRGRVTPSLLVSLKCALKLAQRATHFNCAKRLLQCTVPLLNHRNPSVGSIVADMVRDVFTTDELKTVTLEIVELIRSTLESKKQWNQIQPQLLAVLTHLPLDTCTRTPPSKQVKSKSKADAEVERAFKRDMKKSEMELSPEKLFRLQSQILQKVFWVYFATLRSDNVHAPVLEPVLAGLAKFAHLINVDALLESVDLLKTILQSGRLSLVASFHCLLSAIRMVSGNGECLMIDVAELHTQLYRLLGTLRDKLWTVTSHEHVALALQCVEQLYISSRRREAHSGDRVLAVCKRLFELGVHLRPVDQFSLLVLVARLASKHPQIVDLVHERPLPVGEYEPNAANPAQVCASAASAWEMVLFRQSWDPLVRSKAEQLFKGAPARRVPIPVPSIPKDSKKQRYLLAGRLKRAELE